MWADDLDDPYGEDARTPVARGEAMSGEANRERAAQVRRLLLGSLDIEWQQDAACKGEDPRIFWRPHEAHAKAICARCPVIEDCLRHALEADESGGVWGGMTDRERRALKAGKPVVRLCAWCSDEYTWLPKPGRPRTYCSVGCQNAARYETQLASKARTNPAIGTMLERGHGLISRYHAGCRCSACRRVAREKRGEARRSA